MTLAHGFTNELKMLTKNDTLGAVAGELLNVTLDRIGSSVNTPMYLSASFPTPNSLLNIGPSLVESGDGAGKSISPIGSVIPNTVLTTINFHTGVVTGQTVKVDGGTFALPTGTFGMYTRYALVLHDDGSIDSTFSAESATIGGLTNAGSLLAGLAIGVSVIPIGWVDLECDGSGIYRTAGSLSSIIENNVGLESRIVRSGLLEDSGSGFGIVRVPGKIILSSGGAPTDFNLSVNGTILTVQAGFVRLGDGSELQAVSNIEFTLTGVREVTAVTAYQGYSYDVVGAGCYIQFYDGLGAGHYFWFKGTDSAHPQTDPAQVGTGHEVDILVGAEESGNITVVDYTKLSGASIYFYNPLDPNPATSYVTLTEGVDWFASSSNNATAASIASAIQNSASINSYLTASSFSAIVTVIRTIPGDIGTQVSSSDGTNLPCPGPLSGGVVCDSAHSIAITLASSIAAVSSSFIAPVPYDTIITVTNVVGGLTTDTTSNGVSFTVSTEGADYANDNYYLYVDLTTLGEAILVNGRRVYPVTSANLMLSSLSPEFGVINAYNYPTQMFALGSVQKTGGIWENAQTIALKEWAERLNIENINPLDCATYVDTEYGTNGITLGSDSWADGRVLKCASRLQATASGILSEATLYLFQVAANSAIFSVCADDSSEGGIPGTLLATSGPITLPTSTTIISQTFSLDVGVTIVAGTYYWLVLEVPDDGYSTLTLSTMTLPTGGWSQYNYYESSGGQWSYISGISPYYGFAPVLGTDTIGFPLYNNYNKIVVTDSTGQIPFSLLFPIQDMLYLEQTARMNADCTLQSNIDAVSANVYKGDASLTGPIVGDVIVQSGNLTITGPCTIAGNCTVIGGNLLLTIASGSPFTVRGDLFVEGMINGTIGDIFTVEGNIHLCGIGSTTTAMISDLSTMISFNGTSTQIILGEFGIWPNADITEINVFTGNGHLITPLNTYTGTYSGGAGGTFTLDPSWGDLSSIIPTWNRFHGPISNQVIMYNADVPASCILVPTSNNAQLICGGTFISAYGLVGKNTGADSAHSFNGLTINVAGDFIASESANAIYNIPDENASTINTVDVSGSGNGYPYNNSYSRTLAGTVTVGGDFIGCARFVALGGTSGSSIGNGGTLKVQGNYTGIYDDNTESYFSGIDVSGYQGSIYIGGNAVGWIISRGANSSNITIGGNLSLCIRWDSSGYVPVDYYTSNFTDIMSVVGSGSYNNVTVHGVVTFTPPAMNVIDTLTITASGGQYSRLNLLGGIVSNEYYDISIDASGLPLLTNGGTGTRGGNITIQGPIYAPITSITALGGSALDGVVGSGNGGAGGGIALGGCTMREIVIDVSGGSGNGSGYSSGAGGFVDAFGTIYADITASAGGVFNSATQGLAGTIVLGGNCILQDVVQLGAASSTQYLALLGTVSIQNLNLSPTGVIVANANTEVVNGLFLETVTSAPATFHQSSTAIAANSAYWTSNVNATGSGWTTLGRDNAETTARINADITLQNNINTEVTARTNADNSEATTRANADTTLQANINTEITARSSADNSEITARANADITLQNNINTEITARTNADNAEITTRANADTTLQSNINAEITARTRGDSTLQAAINAITPGLIITPVTAAAISGTTLSNNRHYLIDMNAASGNISVNLPAVSSGLVMWLTVVRNKTNNYRVTVIPNGADLIYYNGASYTAMTMYFLESWAQFMSDGTRWYVDDPSDGGTIGTAPLGIISNIIASPSTADPDWGSSNATVTTTTTSGQLPLEGIINSAIAITSPTLGGYGRIRWTVPTALKARRFIVEWQQIASSLLSGDFRVEIYTNTASDYSGTSTKLPLTTDVSSTSGIPNINGRYHTWFTTDASLSYYEMRIVRTAGTSATIYLTNVLASPILEEEIHGIVFVNAAGTTAKVGDTIGADSTSGAFTITAPANPIPGNRFRVIDVGGVANTNNITIGRNGSNIASLAVDMDIDINWLDVTLTYYNATVGWAPSR